MAMPRPLSTGPSCFDDAANFGFQFAIFATSSRTPSHSGCVVIALRYRYGSWPAACASSSMNDSDAQPACVQVGARSGHSANIVGGTFPVTRRCAMFGKYWSPAENVSIRAPAAGGFWMLTPLASGALRTETKLVESAGTAIPIWIDAGVGLLLNTIMFET